MQEPFEYLAWLANNELPPDDEDHEWCAVIIVLADTIDEAQSRGDELIRGFCEDSFDVFLRSSVEPHICSLTPTTGQKHPCP
ncbi:MAG: hypothetical protein QOE71_365, partial [Pseudonocardiales bacterium]|nr:hypothetical protein [Pseudonocardiales bacterium]